jgi:hypothetical protein
MIENEPPANPRATAELAQTRQCNGPKPNPDRLAHCLSRPIHKYGRTIRKPERTCVQESKRSAVPRYDVDHSVRNRMSQFHICSLPGWHHLGNEFGLRWSVGNSMCALDRRTSAKLQEGPHLIRDSSMSMRIMYQAQPLEAAEAGERGTSDPRCACALLGRRGSQRGDCARSAHSLGPQ